MWYCSILLLNRDIIREQQDIDSDEFNDLILLEKKIVEFREDHLFTSAELELLDMMYGSKIEDPVRYATLLRRYFDGICTKLTIALGGIFTDEGYIDYMHNKYNLTDEQVNTIEKYMLSHLRHKVIHQPFRENTK